jgi:hypothetical protein
VRFSDGTQGLFDTLGAKHAVVIPPSVDATRPLAVQVVPVRAALRGPAAVLIARPARHRSHRPARRA